MGTLATHLMIDPDPWERRVPWLTQTQSTFLCSLVSAAFTAGAISSAGDVLCQFFEGGSLDPLRTARMALYRVLVWAPVYFVFLALLEKAIPSKPASAGTVFKKMLADQLLFTPVAICLFFTVMTMLEGGTLAEGRSRVHDMLWSTLKVNWPFWGTIQCFNYSLVPVQHRVLVVSCVNVFWSGFLSYLNHQALMTEIKTS